MSRVIESRWNASYEDVYVRVWRNEEEYKILYDNQDLMEKWLEWVKIAFFARDDRRLHLLANNKEPEYDTPEEVVLKLPNMLFECGRINAIEVMISGQGMVYYPEWP